MPLPKRRRMFTPKKNSKSKSTSRELEEFREQMDSEVLTARGRLKGALMEVMEPMADESDASSDHYTPIKRDSQDQKFSSDEDEKPARKKSPQRQSYVLKLFDRSVDLSQFTEDSPLYPICRAWIINQPKTNYKDIGKRRLEPLPSEDSIELPGPEGPPICKIPKLLPEQKACSKENINLNYREAPPPSKEQLLQWHLSRWAAVRGAWLQQATAIEARYNSTQLLLNKINANAP